MEPKICKTIMMPNIRIDTNMSLFGGRISLSNDVVCCCRNECVCKTLRLMWTMYVERILFPFLMLRIATDDDSSLFRQQTAWKTFRAFF